MAKTSCRSLAFLRVSSCSRSVRASAASGHCAIAARNSASLLSMCSIHRRSADFVIMSHLTYAIGVSGAYHVFWKRKIFCVPSGTAYPMLLTPYKAALSLSLNWTQGTQSDTTRTEIIRGVSFGVVSLGKTLIEFSEKSSLSPKPPVADDVNDFLRAGDSHVQEVRPS